MVDQTPSVRVTMNLFHHRYYRITKTLMTLVGQWPWQSTRARWSIPAIFISIGFFQIVSGILATVKYRDNFKILLECIISFLFGTVCATKLINFVWNSQTTFKLLNRIRTDWKVWARDKEVNIIHKYAEQGENMIIAYTATLCSTTFLFAAQPITSKIIDVLLKNGTEPGTFVVPMDLYHLDVQKYYFYIYLYSIVSIYICVTIFIASDAMLITYVQHVCGLFAALGQKMVRLGTHDTLVKKRDSSYALNKRNMLDLASCINRHNDAIEYADLIEATFKWSFFFIIGLGMILVISIGIEILLNKSNLLASVKFIAYALTGIFHFFVECYISQMLIDRSIDIHFYSYDSQWYRMSPKAQKLVQFITMRSSVPCQLTAGNFFIMSVSTFSQTVRAAMSYFSFARTMQM